MPARSRKIPEPRRPRVCRHSGLVVPVPAEWTVWVLPQNIQDRFLMIRISISYRARAAGFEGRRTCRARPPRPPLRNTTSMSADNGNGAGDETVSMRAGRRRHAVDRARLAGERRRQQVGMAEHRLALGKVPHRPGRRVARRIARTREQVRAEQTPLRLAALRAHLACREAERFRLAPPRAGKPAPVDVPLRRPRRQMGIVDRHALKGNVGLGGCGGSQHSACRRARPVRPRVAPDQHPDRDRAPTACRRNSNQHRPYRGGALRQDSTASPRKSMCSSTAWPLAMTRRPS